MRYGLDANNGGDRKVSKRIPKEFKLTLNAGDKTSASSFDAEASDAGPTTCSVTRPVRVRFFG
jgi:hypothetical protein